jgi:Phage T7 capsid assembly protein
VRLLAKIREDMGEKPIPMGEPIGEGVWSEEEFYAANRDPRYVKDPAFREKVDKMGERIFRDRDPNDITPGIGIAAPKPPERRERGNARAQ